MATQTVRVTASTRERLRRLTARTGMSTAEVLEDLTRRAEEEEKLDQFNAYFTDPVAAREYHRSETEAWQGTLNDGLDAL